jgi:glycosyltransferase involved in cell wall biosynthesis
MEIKLSVVIITLNEEKNIGRCLEAALRVADDLVVVDSFSTDRTKEICESFGARFIERAFTGHIDQKNFAVSQALYPYILSLDADEVLSEELKAAILRIKQHWKKDAYRMTRLTNYCGYWIRHSAWYPDWKVRLFDRSKARWGGENPHDRIVLSPDATEGRLSGDLLHYSYSSVKQHLDQVNYFTGIASQELKAKGKKAWMWQLLLKPPFRFANMYFFRLGFLDGFAGFCIAVISSYAVFVKYTKLYFANKKIPPNENFSD